MAAITAHCNAHGVPVIWDLSHSAGAVPLTLNDWGVEYAVGCTYKFLNGGPGAPAYIYMAQDVIAAHEPVVTGWFSHANQFGFEDRYCPTDGIEKCLVGTPPILSLRGVHPRRRELRRRGDGGCRRRNLKALSELLIDLADERLADHGFMVASPREPEERGSQVSFRHPEAYAVSKALRAAGVVADFRSPDILRFGITPLYMRHVDVWDAVDALAGIMAGDWLDDAQDGDTRRGHVRRAATRGEKCALGRRGVFPDEALAGAADQPGLLDPDALLRRPPPPFRSADRPCRALPRISMARVLVLGRHDDAKADAHVEDPVHLGVLDPTQLLEHGEDRRRRGQRVEPHADLCFDASQVEEAVAGDVAERVHRHRARQQVQRLAGHRCGWGRAMPRPRSRQDPRRGPLR